MGRKPKRLLFKISIPKKTIEREMLVDLKSRAATQKPTCDATVDCLKITEDKSSNAEPILQTQG